MFKWINTHVLRREQRAPQSRLEQAPVQQVMRGICGGSRRRGVTRRPLGMVRLQNRRSNQLARASRRVNRS